MFFFIVRNQRLVTQYEKEHSAVLQANSSLPRMKLSRALNWIEFGNSKLEEDCFHTVSSKATCASQEHLPLHESHSAFMPPAPCHQTQRLSLLNLGSGQPCVNDESLAHLSSLTGLTSLALGRLLDGVGHVSEIGE